MPVGQEMQDEFEDDNLLAAGPRDCILDEENMQVFFGRLSASDMLFTTHVDRWIDMPTGE